MALILPPLCFLYHSIYKVIRKVLFLGIVDQRSYKGLILDAPEISKF